MKKLITFLMLSTAFLLLSAEKEESDYKALEFDINVKFPTNVKHSYRFDSETNVKRIYEDSSTYEFKRVYTYFITFWAVEKQKDGIQKIWTVLDSMEYNLKIGDKEVNYHYLQDEVPPAHIPDFKKTFIPNSAEFYMYYDSYGVVSKIDGGNIDYKLNYINDPEYGFQEKNYDWKTFMNRYSVQDLSHIADPAKGVLPPYPVARDSSWKIDFKFDINQTTFGGITEPYLKMLAGNSYFIEMDIDSLTIIDEYYDLPDMKILAGIDSSEANGKLEMKIATKGHIEYLQAQTSAWINGSVQNRRFREEITATQKWELLGMWYL